MGLAAIHSAIATEFNLGRATAVPVLLGDEHLEEHGRPPRVVCVPTSDTFSPAEKGGHNPRPIRTRNIGTFWRVWALSLADAETMLNDLIAAVHVATGGNYSLGEADWLTKGSLTQLGAACDVDLTFQVPVTARPHATATTTAAEGAASITATEPITVRVP
jgi:hypothetical protein